MNLRRQNGTRFFKNWPEFLNELASQFAYVSVRTIRIKENKTMEPLIHPEDQRVLLQINQMDQKASGWLSKLIWLGVSLFAFVAAGALAWDWELLLLLIPVLLFHEAGHFIAMKMLNYQDVKMFFLPLLGAAVHGRNHHAPGWQRAIVALAGPLPGVLLGFLMGLLAIYWQSEILHKSAILMLVINGFNLLPFLPFDGGWVMQTVIFSRNAYLDFAFRVIAVIALFGLGIMTDSKIMCLLAIVLGAGLPGIFGLTKVVHALRRENVYPKTDRESGYCQSTLQKIAKTIRETLTVPELNRAQSVINVYEQITARSPGVSGSVAILAFYMSGLVAAFACTVGLVVQKQGFFNRGDGSLVERRSAMVRVLSKDVETFAGESFDQNESGRSIAIQCAENQIARNTFQNLKTARPDDQLACRIGRNIVVEIDPADELAVLKLHDLCVLEGCLVAGVLQNIAPSFQLEFNVATESDAERVEFLLSSYFGTDLREWLIVPWTSANDLTERQFTLRQQYFDMTTVKVDFDDQEFGSSKVVNEIRQWIDSNQIDQKLGNKYLQRQALQQSIYFARNEDDQSQDSIDNQYDQLDQLNRELASMLGAIADGDSELSVALVRDTAYCDRIERQGSRIVLYNLYFNNPASGLVNLAQWLHREGVMELQLGFVPDSFDRDR